MAARNRMASGRCLGQTRANLAKGDYVSVEGELRSSRYERNVQVIGGGQATVPVTSWEIRARAVRKLVRKKSAKA